MEARWTSSDLHVRDAIAIDALVTGSAERAGYIGDIANRGGLSVVHEEDAVIAFCCLDAQYFFERPFLSLLMVHPDARRRGAGRRLLRFNAGRAEDSLWTSTNRSNEPMRALLKSEGWRFCGEVSGLDPGDPERFYRMSSG